MQFHAYKVNDKHRAAAPTEDASIWTVTAWVELHLFSEAGLRGWQSTKGGKNFLWAAYHVGGKLLQIGSDPQGDLYIAKFRCDHNQEWHGYPVLPRDDDIPPDQILEYWRQAGMVDKTEKRRIQKGQYSP